MMSSTEIKKRYGEFAETARREPVVHTQHGRRVLVTMSYEKARELPEFRRQEEAEQEVNPPPKHNTLLDLIGVGRTYSIYKSGDEILEAIRAMREDRF